MLIKLQSRERGWLLGLALLVLTCLAYGPVIHGGFVWDDDFIIVNNVYLRDLNGLHAFWFTTKYSDPVWLTMTSLWLQWHLWQANPLGYHIVNVLTHGFAVILLWQVLSQLRLSGAWLAAAVFAIHPVAAASVAWCSEQKNTLSLLFFLLSIWAYLRYDLTTVIASPSISGRFVNSAAVWYVASLFFFVLALLSKGSTVMLPIILLLVTWWRGDSVSRSSAFGARLFLRLVPYFLLSAGAAYLTIWFQYHKAISGETVQNLSLTGRLAASAWAVVFYVWKGMVPVRLCAIYPPWDINPAAIFSWLPLVSLVGIFFVGWHFRKNWGRHVLFGLGYVVVTLFPVMGFFNMYFMVFSRVADHLQYLALAGTVAMAVSVGVYSFEKLIARFQWLRPVGPLVALLLLSFLACSTWGRAEAYSSEERLWSDTLRKNPNSSMAHNNLGLALAAKGNAAEAKQEYENALQANPNNPEARNNLGLALFSEGNLSGAISQYEQILQRHANSAIVHYNLANVLASQGKLGEALPHYQIILRSNPDYAEMRYNLANALAGLGYLTDAISNYQRAIELVPNFAEAHNNLGVLLANQGRLPEAISHYRQALQIKPNYPEAHNSLALALTALGNFAEARQQQQPAAQLPIGQNENVINEAIGRQLKTNQLRSLPRSSP